MKQIVNENLKYESIGAGVHIYVSDQHPFGTDAILLANFACVKGTEYPCDMGTGCGIIPFLWARYSKPKKIFAVEIQQNAVELVKKSIAANALEKRVEICNTDIRQIDSSFEKYEKFDVVTMNPPYKPVNTGFESEDDSQKIARHEIMCTIDDVVKAGRMLLKFGGRLCLCHRPERLADIIVSMRNGGIEPKKIRMVSSKIGKKPFLVLVEGRKGGKHGLQFMPELYVRNSDGSWTDEMLKIYGDYGDRK